MNLYGPVRAAAFEGTADVVLHLAAWPEGNVAPTAHEITVLPPKATKTEPTTDRLTKTLPHPDRKANVGVVRFSPDGARLMGSGYPSGVVQFWDTKTWAETARLDTPTGLRASWDYAIPTPDWKGVLVYGRTRKVVKEEKGGKVTERLQVDGRIDVYDPASGKRTDTVALPDRGPQQLWMAPDGKSVVLNTEGSFAATDRDRPSFTERLDLTTKTATKLFDTYSMPAFTPDGKAAFFAVEKYTPNGGFEHSFVRYDLAAGKVTATKQEPDKETFFGRPAASPDGSRLFGTSGRSVNAKTEGFALAVLDPATLAEKARLPLDADPDAAATFTGPLFTADGKTAVIRVGDRLLLWDVAADKLARTVTLPIDGFGFLAVSPDGKRAAVVGRPKFDAKAVGRNPDAEYLPQPRVVVVELADPKAAPAVLMLPPGGSGQPAFSPDGKTLAVGVTGGVALLDVSKVK